MSLSVVVAYVFPTLAIQRYEPMARRFTQSYLNHPPGDYPHQVVVLVNGPKYNGIERVFSPLPVLFAQHDNTGKDLGAYVMAAATIPCDLLICLGAPIRFRRAGWLDWIVQCYLGNGIGLYGPWGFHQPSTHLRTTAFWCPPELLNLYPYVITNHNRYEVEHGADSLTLWASRMGFPVLQVTWKGVFDMRNWHHVDNAESLFLDQHTDSIGFT